MRLSLDSITGCPCFGCGDLDRCGVGRGSPSPIVCERLTAWIERGTMEMLKGSKEVKP